MMRNKEIRQAALLWFLSMTLILTTAGYTISPLSGVLVLVMAGLSGTLFFAITRKRYQRIARLSEQIDRVLHNEERLKIGEAEEGELSILYSEIVKMTLRIREQNEALRNEKEHLADSLADVAHQLRTPLTSVNIILSLVEKDTDQENQKALLREAGALLEQTDFLLTSLLKLSRLDAKIVVFQKEQIKVKDLLSVALRPLFVSMDLHDIRVRTDIPEEAAVSGDLKWLAEAFRNIIKNSMESVGNNGQIEITCKDNPLLRRSSFTMTAQDFLRRICHICLNVSIRGNIKRKIAKTLDVLQDTVSALPSVEPLSWNRAGQFLRKTIPRAALFFRFGSCTFLLISKSDGSVTQKSRKSKGRLL